MRLAGLGAVTFVDVLAVQFGEPDHDQALARALRVPDDAVAKPFAVIAGHDELHGLEEAADEYFLLVAYILADAFGQRDAGSF